LCVHFCTVLMRIKFKLKLRDEDGELATANVAVPYICSSQTQGWLHEVQVVLFHSRPGHQANPSKMQHSQFTVAGMSSSTSSHHSPNLNTWGSTSTSGPLTSTFGDHSLSQSRSHYQSGYLMVSPCLLYAKIGFLNNTSRPRRTTYVI
jgi:hypothetical protein